MPSELGEAYVDVRAKFDKFDKDLSGAKSMLGGALSAIGTAGAAAAIAGLTAIGVAAGATALEIVGMASDFQNATKAIIIGTGASGDELAGMEKVVKNLKGTTAGLGKDFGELGEVVAEVDTRTGATGETLEKFSKSVLDLSRLSGGDAKKNVQLITRVMGDWGIEIEDSSQLMDQLFGASQAFGISVDSLAAKVVQFGAPLRNMGFTLEESIALLGKWEQEGVNTELVLGSLRIAAGHFANAGIPLREGLNQTIETIKNAKTSSEGLAIAMDVFGARAGPDMAAAIREGRFELEGAITALQGTAGGLEDAANRALTLQERFTILKDGVLVALMPIGQIVLDLAEQFMPLLQEAVKRLMPILEKFGEEIGPATKEAGAALLELGQALGITSEDLDILQAILITVKYGLDSVTNTVRAITIMFKVMSYTIQAVSDMVESLKMRFAALGTELNNMRDKLPDWMKPGSPTPLEMGIRGLSDAINQIPDFSSKFEFKPSFAGMGAMGSSSINNTTVNVGSVSATSHNSNPADEAIRLTMQLLRNQLKTD
jgi:phage-related minor tail protein